MKGIFRNARTVLTAFLLVICLASCALLAACTPQQGNDGPVGSVNIVEKSVQISQYDEKTLTLSVSNLDESKVVWTTSAPAVCSVENGTIKGLTVGTATITAAIGDYSDTCEVTVNEQKNLAKIRLSQEDAVIRVGGNVKVTADVLYMGNKVNADISWETSDSAVCTVNNGTITGVSVGTATVTATAVYQGETVAADLAVTVKADVDLLFGDNNIDLKTSAAIDGAKAGYTFAPVIKCNGTAVDATFSYAGSNDDVLVVSSSGVVAAKGEGVATVTITATVTGECDIKDKVYTETVSFSVTKSTLTLEKDEEVFEVYAQVNAEGVKVANEYVLDLSSYGVVCDGKTVVTLESNGKTVVADYDLANGGSTLKIDGASFGGEFYGDVKVTVSNTTEVLDITLDNVVTKYIATKEDFYNMPVYGGIIERNEEKQRPYNGYFVMTADIKDFGGEESTYFNGKNSYQYLIEDEGYYGFQGIFEGNGHSITGVKVGGMFRGLFGNTASNSVIRNLGVKATLTIIAETGCNLLGRNVNGKIENCYFDVYVDSSSIYRSGYFTLGENLAHASIKNTVIVFDAGNAPEGALVGLFATKLGVYQGSWVYNTEFSNVHVFYKGAECYGGAAYTEGVTAYPYDEVRGYKTYGYTDKVEISTLDGEYWNMKGDQPIFKSSGAAVKRIAYAGETYQEKAFEVYSGIVGTVPTANVFTLDLNGLGLPATVDSVILVSGGNEIEGAGTYSNGVVTIDGNKFGSKIYGEISLKVIDGDVAYEVSSFNVVTKYLSKKQDVTNMKWYGNLDKTTTQKNYGGYFVMTRDITLDYASSPCWESDEFFGAWEYYSDLGFTGVFDGAGHTLSGLWAFGQDRSLFGNVAASGVIKNVAITDVEFRAVNGKEKLFAINFSGSIENVYIDVAISADSSYGKSDSETGCISLLAEAMHYARMNDVVIKYDATNLGQNASTVYFTYSPSIFTWEWVNALTCNNVHVFTDCENSHVYGGSANPLKGTHTKYAYDGTATGVTMTDATWWDLSGNQPAWKGAPKPQTVTVSFDKNDASDIAEEEYELGELVNKPEDPVVAGWTFDGWYNGDAKWDFATYVVEGEMTLKAKYTKTVEVTDVFEVCKDPNGPLDPAENTPQGTANLTFNVLTINGIPTLPGEVTAVTANGTAIEYALGSEVLTVNGKAFGSKIYGDVKIVITDGAYSVVVNLDVVTKYISKDYDIRNMKYYGGFTTSSLVYDGYFVLKNDIVCNNTPNYPTWWNGDVSGAVNAIDETGESGFHGIFDGNGYQLTKVKVWGSGYKLFSSVAKTAVIKNLAITDVVFDNTLHGDYLFGRNFAGTLQNFYLELKINSASIENGDQINYLAENLAFARFKDVVIKYDASVAINAGVTVPYLANRVAVFSGWDWSNKMTCENVHVFTQSEQAYIYGVEGDYPLGTIDGVTRYAYDGTATDVTMTDSTYWDLSGKQPVWCGKKVAVTFDKNDASDVDTKYYKEGDLIAEPEAAPAIDGWTFDGWYNGDVKWNFATDVVKGAMTLKARYAKTVDVTDTFEVYQSYDYSLDGGWSGNVDMSALNTNVLTVNAIPVLPNAVTSVTANGTAIAYALEGGVLTVNGKAFGPKIYGDVKVVITDGAYSVVVNVNVVTKYLNNAYDFQNMEFFGGIEKDKELKPYYGYFVMTCDLELPYATFSNWWADNCIYAGTDETGESGFHGIFDGQGYAITDFFINNYNYMLFSNVAKDSVLKNFSLTVSALSVTVESTSLFGTNFAGTLQNVYMDVKLVNVGDVKKVDFFAENLAYARFKDVVIKYDAKVAITAKVPAAYLAYQVAIFSGWDWSHKITCENVHAFTQSENAYYYGAEGETTVGEITGVTRYAYDGTATGVTMTDSTYWDLSGNQPAWKGKTA